jgi:hypothetical protein
VCLVLLLWEAILRVSLPLCFIVTSAIPAKCPTLIPPRPVHGLILRLLAMLRPQPIPRSPLLVVLPPRQATSIFGANQMARLRSPLTIIRAPWESPSQPMSPAAIMLDEVVTLYPHRQYRYICAQTWVVYRLKLLPLILSAPVRIHFRESARMQVFILRCGCLPHLLRPQLLPD